MTHAYYDSTGRCYQILTYLSLAYQKAQLTEEEN